MEFDNTAQIKLLSQLPSTQEPPRDDRSAWGAPIRAIKAAAADVTGSLADVVKGYGAAGAIAAEADPVARAALGDEAIRAGAAEGRRQFAADEALDSDVGRSFRNVSESLRPDPATASTAEKLIFGITRPASKIVAGAALGGPIGAGFAGFEEGFTQADELKQQGVDLPTRTAVGGLTGVANTVGALLPMAGSTVKGTLGLYVAGGPGGFVAQQAATRAILEGANYDEIARQYDPLDPVGLAVSALIPLPFAAKAVAGARQRVELDAAMTHNLTLHQDAAQVRAATEPPPEPPVADRIAPPAPPEPDLPPAPAAESAIADTVLARLKTVEQEQPAVAAQMEAARKQIADGTDEELGTLDADLLRVAAECSLSVRA